MAGVAVSLPKESRPSKIGSTESFPRDLAQVVNGKQFAILCFKVPMIPSITGAASQEIFASLVDRAFEIIGSEYQVAIRFDASNLSSVALEKQRLARFEQAVLQ